VVAGKPDGASTMFHSINAVTLATHDMARAVRFYGALGLDIIHGGEHAPFTSFKVGSGHLNLVSQPPDRTWWGRVIVYVADVDLLHRRAVAAGLRPHAEPRDAEWGERYFHLTDSDGHELSFARPSRPAGGDTE
jgi:catechol 2,3-dioxygenase-like lactoylglutathione lyase family enzyme